MSSAVIAPSQHYPSPLHLVQLKHVERDGEGVFPSISVEDLEQLRDTSGGETGLCRGAVDLWTVG